VVPRGGLSGTKNIKDLSCPTLAGRSIELQGVFSRLSHQNGPVGGAPTEKDFTGWRCLARSAKTGRQYIAAQLAAPRRHACWWFRPEAREEAAENGTCSASKFRPSTVSRPHRTDLWRPWARCSTRCRPAGASRLRHSMDPTTTIMSRDENDYREGRL
jgi:hypothetical protein